ncbi:MAG: amino acid permease, partial [Alphaproteobacteria bacterium]|nr:amino acid permease [Alphaproteobacteria bacterium]
MDVTANTPQQQEKKRIGLIALTLLVVSAMMGGGVFNLPQNMAQSASLGAVLIAWVVSALGIFFLARSFQVLADVKPELKAGIYAYSRTGFGRYVGFQIAWGYWLSAAFGNVAFAVLVMDSFNYFFPPYFKGGNSWEAILVASAILWIMNWLVLRGIRGVVALNVVATIAKLIPVIAFLFVVAISMKAGMWGSDLWGTVVSHPASHTHLGSVLDQVKSTMLVTLWVYIGIEGAVVMSETSDERTVGRATILGFAVVTTLYVLSSILPF